MQLFKNQHVEAATSRKHIEIWRTYVP